MSSLAESLCEIGRRAYAAHLVDGSAGNFSARLDADRVLCTPTGLCKGRLRPDDLCVVRLDGTQVGGRRRRSSEILMHLELYAARPAIRALVHTHPPFATTFAAVGETPPEHVLPEADVYLGPVPLIPYQSPGTRAMGVALRPYVATHVAALLTSHGAVTWGPDLETAYIRMETLESLCRVAYQARQLGTLRQIPADKRAELAQLGEKYRGAG